MAISKTLKAARNKMMKDYGHKLDECFAEHERDYAASRAETKQINPFRVGDYVEVKTQVKKGDKVRTVSFKGHCIAKTNRGLPVSKDIPGLGSSFKILRLAGDQRIVKHFCLHGSPSAVEVITQNISRRVKRYDLVRNKKISKISLKRDFSQRK